MGKFIMIFHNKKILIPIIFLLLFLIIFNILVIIKLSQPKTIDEPGTERFTGVITDYEPCPPAMYCTIIIGDKRLIVEQQYGLVPPEIESTHSIQYLGKWLDADFTINSREEIKQVLVGKKVEVYAKKIKENNYTLFGSENYYIKFLH